MVTTTPTPTDNTPDNNEALLARYFGEAHKKVLSKLKFRYNFERHTLEDLTAAGIEYAARYYLKEGQGSALTLTNMTRLAFWAADNRAKDLLRHQARRPEALILNDVDETEDGESLAESPLLIRASWNRWQEQCYDRRWKALGDFALRHLDEMFDILHLNAMRRGVFRAIYLEEEEVAEVCRRYNIKPNYAYGIVFNAKKGLAKIGPSFLKAA